LIPRLFTLTKDNAILIIKQKNIITFALEIVNGSETGAEKWLKDVTGQEAQSLRILEGVWKMRKKAGFVCLAVVLAVVSLSGCGKVRQEAKETKEERREETTVQEEKEESTESGIEEEMGSPTEEIRAYHSGVVQEDDEYRYVYAGNIYKVHKESGESEILWESRNAGENAWTLQRNMLLYGNLLYFIEEPAKDSSSDRTMVLSVIRTDGTGYQKLADGLEGDASLYRKGNLFYILMYHTEICYEIGEDGTLGEETETDAVRLWNSLEGEYGHCSYPDAGTQYLSAAESLERYGCVLAYDENHALCTVDADGTESIMTESGDMKACNKDHVLVYEYGEAGRAFYLTDMKRMERRELWKQDYKRIVGMDEDYVYFGSDEEDYSQFVLGRLSLADGTKETLFTMKVGKGDRYVPTYMTVFSKDANCVYYIRNQDYNPYMMAFCPDTMEQEVISPPLHDSGISKVGEIETYEENLFSDAEPDKILMSLNLELLVVDDAFPGAERINQVLRESEEENIRYGEESVSWVEETLQEEGEWDFPTCSLDGSVSDITYFDGDYFSFYMSMYDYQGGAHGMPYHNGYTFDLQTGEQLFLADLLENSEEELKDIVTRYFEEYIGRNPEEFWEDAVDTVRNTVCMDSEFYLNEDGIVFYYGPYDLACFAAGFQEVTVPYEAFRMKIPLGINEEMQP